jgi:hypothetical protein
MRQFQTRMANTDYNERRSRHVVPICAVLLAMLLSFLVSVPAIGADNAIDRKVFDADMSQLMKNPNRLAGREDGSRAASMYVEKRYMCRSSLSSCRG